MASGGPLRPGGGPQPLLSGKWLASQGRFSPAKTRPLAKKEGWEAKKEGWDPQPLLFAGGVPRRGVLFPAKMAFFQTSDMYP